MTATVAQVYYSERLSTDERKNTQKYVSGEIEYIVRNAHDEDVAINAVRNYITTRYKGMILNSIAMDERLDDTSWRVAVTYGYTYGSSGGADSDSDPPDSTLSFDYTTSSKRVERSLATVYSAGVGGNVAENLNNLIGVDADGSVQGVEIMAPVMTFQETHFKKNSFLSTKYRKKLASLVGKVNITPWRGYEAGEVLFLGVSGSRNGTGKDDLWQLQYKFALQSNEDDHTIAGVSGIAKFGWDYAWVRYQEIKDTGGNATKAPTAVYVERVYDYVDFKEIGLGA